MPRRPHTAIIVLSLSFLAVAPGHAQWIEDPGTGWVKVNLSHHDTRTRFDENANKEPYFNKNARSITTTATVTSALGLWTGLDMWAKMPVHHLQFDDVIRDRTSTGLGDPRIFVRMGPSIIGLDTLPLAVAVRGGIKFSVGDFDVRPQIIPLTEGQRDWELLAEIGRSLHPWPLYLMGWVGYRWRELNETTGFKPGNERFFYAAAGGNLNVLTWKVAVDGYFGNATEFAGLVLTRERRQLVQLIPNLGLRIGPGQLEAGARIPLHGRNLPAGTTFTLGYFISWNESLW